jgi:acyl-CoA thioesterase I
MKRYVMSVWLGLSLVQLTQGQIKVACIGNSITEGYGLANASTESYPSRLKALLGNGYTVQNDGASGRTMLKSDAKNSYWKFGKLGQALALKPDIVTIELGTNDANNFASTWNNVSAEFKRDYLAMVDTFNVLAVKPKVYVILPLPIRGNNDPILVKANALIKEVAAERGLTVIDCYTPFNGQAQLYKDGLHPNAVGADTMGHIVYRALTKPLVAIAANRLTASSRSLVPDFEGTSFAFVAKTLANGGRFNIRVYDNRGSLLLSEKVTGLSPELDAIYARVKSAPGIRWVSMERLR